MRCFISVAARPQYDSVNASVGALHPPTTGHVPAVVAKGACPTPRPGDVTY